jgi:hypothetical protein
MTAIMKGELAKAARAGMGRAAQKAAAPAPARKLRLEKVVTIFLSSALDAYGLLSRFESEEGWPPCVETASR